MLSWPEEPLALVSPRQGRRAIAAPLSQLDLRGPEAILPDEIAAAHVTLAARNPHAGRRQQSSVFTEQGPPIDNPHYRRGDAPIVKPTMAALLTDPPPSGVGLPSNYYIDADGDITRLPKHAAESRTRGTLVSTVVFGSAALSEAEVERSFVIPSQRRHVMTRPEQAGRALNWEADEEENNDSSLASPHSLAAGSSLPASKKPSGKVPLRVAQAFNFFDTNRSGTQAIASAPLFRHLRVPHLVTTPHPRPPRRHRAPASATPLWPHCD